jgi:hypothetical protein
VRNAPRTGFCACLPVFQSADPDDEILDNVISDGHWFSIGKVYKAFAEEQLDSTEQHDYGAVSSVNYKWYNHDSKFRAPQVLSSNDELHRFVQLLYSKRRLHMWRVSRLTAASVK